MSLFRSFRAQPSHSPRPASGPRLHRVTPDVAGEFVGDVASGGAPGPRPLSVTRGREFSTSPEWIALVLTYLDAGRQVLELERDQWGSETGWFTRIDDHLDRLNDLAERVRETRMAMESLREF